MTDPLSKAAGAAAECYYKFCNTILTLSTGGLMLSLVMVERGFLNHHRWWLAGSWVCFGLTIVSALIVRWGEWTARQAVVKQIANGEDGSANPDKGYSIASRAMLIFFAGAIISLSVFAVGNIIQQQPGQVSSETAVSDEP